MAKGETVERTYTIEVYRPGELQDLRTRITRGEDKTPLATIYPDYATTVPLDPAEKELILGLLDEVRLAIA